MERADIVIKSNNIFDSINDEPFEGFIAVRKNKIIKVGRYGESADMWIGEDTSVINFEDNLVMPGMVDTHMHFFGGVFQNSPYMCRELFNCFSAKECVETIAKFAASHPEYERIAGMGWYVPIWDDKTQPDRWMLDAIDDDRPIYLMCADGHSFWLNSAAMKESEIDVDKQWRIGEVVKNAEGVPTGVLREMEICAPCSMYMQKLPKDEKRRLLAELIDEISACGITSVSDMAVMLEPHPEYEKDEIDIISDLEYENKLNVRMNLYPSLGTCDDFSVAKEYRRKYCSDMFRVAGLKTFVDGVHGNHTALLIDPYEDLPESRGAAFYPYEVYRDQVREANREGFGVKLHCAGEGATKLALDAYGESHAMGLDKGVRNSIEHVEITRLEDIKLMGQIGVTASMQPVHMMPATESLTERVGKQRARWMYAIKTMLDEGVNVAFGTDYPVVPFNPMPNIYFAVTRNDFEGNPCGDNRMEKITVAQALKAYTIAGAYCFNMEKKIGSIEEGKLADIIAFDRNLFDTEPDALLDAKVVMTMVDGRVVNTMDPFSD